MLTDLEKQVILALQRDLEITPQPFQELAARLGVKEEQVLQAIRGLKEKGYIRRFGATLRHQLSGFEANALVVWVVPEEKLSSLGHKLAGKRVVTHCYARKPAPGWPYNLYTMIHGKRPGEIKAMAAQMAREIGITDYAILFSEAELKKTTMRYFCEGSGSSQTPQDVEQGDKSLPG
jgi:DNA-binding Lrp family transcriptional regulator